MYAFPRDMQKLYTLVTRTPCRKSENTTYPKNTFFRLFSQLCTFKRLYILEILELEHKTFRNVDPVSNIVGMMMVVVVVVQYVLLFRVGNVSSASYITWFLGTYSLQIFCMKKGILYAITFPHIKILQKSISIIICIICHSNKMEQNVDSLKGLWTLFLKINSFERFHKYLRTRYFTK